MKNLDKYKAVLNRRDPRRRVSQERKRPSEALKQGKRQVESRSYLDAISEVLGRRSSKKSRKGGGSVGVLG